MSEDKDQAKAPENEAAKTEEPKTEAKKTTHKATKQPREADEPAKGDSGAGEKRGDSADQPRERSDRGERGDGDSDGGARRGRGRRGSGSGRSGRGSGDGGGSRREPIDAKAQAKMAWKLYQADIAEEGLELVREEDGRKLAVRSFDLARVFLEEKARRAPKGDS